jgi:hypothetical protein
MVFLQQGKSIITGFGFVGHNKDTALDPPQHNTKTLSCNKPINTDINGIVNKYAHADFLYRCSKGGLELEQQRLLSKNGN